MEVITIISKGLDNTNSCKTQVGASRMVDLKVNFITTVLAISLCIRAQDHVSRYEGLIS